jgi:hypothetical protein
MRSIAKLLLGDEAARALDLLAGTDTGDDRDQLSPAEQVRRSGAWCGTTPGEAPSIIVRGRPAR